MAIAATAVACVAACSGPPGVAPPDGAPPDRPLPADAAPPDAAPGPDADPRNPRAISLVDVTEAITSDGALFPAGAADFDPWGIGSGAAIGDLDGDGDLDVVLARNDDPASPRRGGPTTMLRNQGGLTFAVDAPFSALFAGARARGVALGDIDRDGDLDLFVTADGRDRLLENDGGGSFVDVTDAAGVAGPAEHVCAGALFADVNHDGLLDLYVYCTTMSTPPYADDRARNRLHLGVGDGRFVDVSAASGTDSDRTTNAAAAFDLEQSGDLVLYAANDAFCYDGMPMLPEPDRAGDDAWYRLEAIDDQGVPSFTDEGGALGLHACRSSMGVAIADLDLDLAPDFYLTDIGANDLFLGFPPVESTAYGIDARADADGHVFVAWGARFLDLDRDGALELAVIHGATQTPSMCEGFHQIDQLFRQRIAGGPFEEITEPAGWPGTPGDCETLLPALTGRGLATGDLDGDGDDDLVVAPWVEAFRFFRTDVAAPGNAVRLRLRGTVSAPDPIGATVIVTRLDGSRAAGYRYAGGDTDSQSDSALLFGTGDDTSVQDIRVYWPSGLVQRVPLPAPAEIDEPVWLTVEPRVTTTSAELVYTAVDEWGNALGPAGAGRAVIVTRSDGLPVAVNDRGDGSYAATLPHPGVARRTVITISVDGALQRPRPMIDYR